VGSGGLIVAGLLARYGFGQVEIWTALMVAAALLAGSDIRMRDGLDALNSIKELMADIGRPRDNLYEVALWEDLLTVRGDEAFYAYMVDNQAIVIPETIDAIRALTGGERDAQASITRTNATLGIGATLI
jgi:glyceraldehyde-3-phosphate dehydrogenase (NAD(P))